MSIDSESTLTDVNIDQNAPIAAQVALEASELAMLKRNELQAVEGASNKWRDTAGIRQGIQRLIAYNL